MHNYNHPGTKKMIEEAMKFYPEKSRKSLEMMGEKVDQWIGIRQLAKKISLNYSAAHPIIIQSALTYKHADGDVPEPVNQIYEHIPVIAECTECGFASVVPAKGVIPAHCGKKMELI